MADTLSPRRIRERDEEHSTPNGTWFERTYAIPADADLDDQSLQRGQALPENSSALIAESQLVVKPKGVGRVAVVRAFAPREVTF